MRRSRVVAVVALVAGLLIAAAGSGWGGADPAFSQSNLPTPVINTSGQALPVLDGVTGEPVWVDDGPWVIRPGQRFLSHPWGTQPRYVYNGLAYHYIGSISTPEFRFFLVEDWILNGGVLGPPVPGTVPGDLSPVQPVNLPILPTVTPSPTPSPTATPAPSAGGFPVWGNYAVGFIGYEPNCGLTLIKGRVVNPDGGGRSGVQVKLTSGDYTAISNWTNSDGYYDITLANEAKAGTWTVQVWIESGGQSYPVTVQTDTNDCRPNGPGRQVVWVDWQRVSWDKP